MLAHRKRLTLVHNLSELSIQTPTLVNDSYSTSPTHTSNESVYSRLQHRRNPSLPPFPATPSSPLIPSSPRSPLHQHIRRQTYGGDVSPTSRIPLLDVEEKVALLESTNQRLSVELEETRGALLIERERRDTALPAPSSIDNAQSEVLWERKLRMDILDALKKVRTQNTILSRSVREHKDQCESLSSILEQERAQRASAEHELSRITQVNFALFEHNKLLVERDLAFQKMTSSLHPQFEGKTQDDDDDAASSLSQEESLRARLNSTSDNLHITKLQLTTAEEKCLELSEHVSFLQSQMTQCLDSSAQALEVERELRSEFMARAISAEEENSHLNAQLQALERQMPKHYVAPLTVRRRVPLPQRISNKATHRRHNRTMVTSLMTIRKSSRSINNTLPSRPSTAFPPSVRVPSSLANLFLPQKVALDVSSDVCSSNVVSSAHNAAYSLASPLAVRDTSPVHHKGHSVLLSVTLSHKASLPLATLKAVSTCSINVVNTCAGNNDSRKGTKKSPTLMHNTSNERASLVLTDIALRDSGWDFITPLDVS